MAGRSINLLQTVPSLLREQPDKRFTARDIALAIYDKFPDACNAKLARSSALTDKDDLIQQIVAEIGSQRPRMQKEHPQIKTTESRPRHYYWTDKSEIEEVTEAENKNIYSVNRISTDKEIDIYPKLAQFIWSELGIYSMRIDEKRSSNRNGSGGNKWLYPDVVGMEILTRGFHQKVHTLVSVCSNPRTRLWSFEVKSHLNRSNVRQAFFQAVSNSSWAGFGYLVAAEIEGSDTINELRILSAAHGIGLIELDKENPSESRIVIPARENPDVDWATCNRIASENSDFLTFIRNVREFYQTGNPRGKDWYIQSD